VDALKLIPQLFFDLIARIVPGTVVFMLWVWIWPGITWAGLLDTVAAKHLNDANVFAFAFFLPLGLGYILGHLVAPLGKWLRKWSARKEIVEPWRHYDWLRMHCPDAGSLAAKIRAEYTMHFSLAAAFLLAVVPAATRAYAAAAPNVDWWLPVVLVALALLSLYRGHETLDKFCQSVHHFYAVGQERIPPPDPPWSDQEPAPLPAAGSHVGEPS
jgi:hypothetical protein